MRSKCLYVISALIVSLFLCGCPAETKSSKPNKVETWKVTTTGSPSSAPKK